mmetsp:Transcript_50248/g.93418  ORF Transcript_50248/g.93418 Transcript_50248/m.93418 type:complete len:384 (+) Transcript_50248:622-1773(+)
MHVVRREVVVVVAALVGLSTTRLRPFKASVVAAEGAVAAVRVVVVGAGFACAAVQDVHQRLQVLVFLVQPRHHLPHGNLHVVDQHLHRSRARHVTVRGGEHGGGGGQVGGHHGGHGGGLAGGDGGARKRSRVQSRVVSFQTRAHVYRLQFAVAVRFQSGRQVPALDGFFEPLQDFLVELVGVGEARGVQVHAHVKLHRGTLLGLVERFVKEHQVAVCFRLLAPAHGVRHGLEHHFFVHVPVALGLENELHDHRHFVGLRRRRRGQGGGGLRWHLRGWGGGAGRRNLGGERGGQHRRRQGGGFRGHGGGRVARNLRGEHGRHGRREVAWGCGGDLSGPNGGDGRRRVRGRLRGGLDGRHRGRQRRGGLGGELGRPRGRVGRGEG